MSVDGWRSVLVLGGIRSGKSAYAESLVADHGQVRYVATAAGAGPDDPEWSARLDAHRRRRPLTWTTEETAADPGRLIEVLTAAAEGETLLVDDLGGWVSVLLDPAHQPADDVATVTELAGAVRACAARLVLVSPEVGLSLVPTTPLGRAFADALGTTNRAVAEVCDAVVLVVAGQPTWLKPSTPPAGWGHRTVADPPHPADPGVLPAGERPDRAVTVPVQHSRTGTDQPPDDPDTSHPGPTATGVDGAPAEPDPTGRPAGPTPARSTWTAPTMTLPMVATGLVIQYGMELPLPDEYAGPQALDRLATLDVPGAGLGQLGRVVAFAAATQGTATPQPWRRVRVLMVNGDHHGGLSAGCAPGESARRAEQARRGEGALARLADEAGATLRVVDAPTAGPVETGAALTPSAVEAALRHGWRLAEEAADDGVHMIVLAAGGAGTDAAAAAVLAAAAGAEPAAVLGRVVAPGGQFDDAAWMARCAAVRDALHRTRRVAVGAKDVLAELAGGDVAVATGVLLGATARRVPVLVDGPVGISAAVLSRDLAGQARHWCLLPDHGGHPAVRLAAEVLGLEPLFDLRLDLGEGATALTALPLMRAALSLARTLPVHPTIGPADGPDPADATDPAHGPAGTGWDRSTDDGRFTEPEPEGPGPATPEAPAHPQRPTPDGAPAPDERPGPTGTPAPDEAPAPDGRAGRPGPTGHGDDRDLTRGA
jgi:nicotinate-nucleotide--dimethylbenzimidazole phosphoribosyltransferase